MSNKKLKNSSLKNKNEGIIVNTQRKIDSYLEIINNTILASQKYKTLDIISANELNNCIKSLNEIHKKLKILQHVTYEKTKNIDEIISKLQNITIDLSCVFRVFGTLNLKDLLDVCFDCNYLQSQTNESNKNKLDLLLKYVHPISYKILNWKDNKNHGKNKNTTKEGIIMKNKIVEDFMILEISKTFDCFDLARTSQNFQTKVYGIKISFQNTQLRQTIIVSGIVDDLYLECFESDYINSQKEELRKNKPTDPIFLTEDFDRFVNSITLKEWFVYSVDELTSKFIGYMNQVNLIKQKPISQVVKEFLNSQMYQQRTTLIQLLLKYSNNEFQYLAYLLYDLLTNDNNGNIDTIEQTILYDSLPWSIKKYFKDAMKTTLQYTNSLANFDNNKIPLEQQICLMKVSDNVKEKAMVKLKEVKAKSDDSGSKARQYLEGLLKIPFGIYKKEEILCFLKEIRMDFKKIIDNVELSLNVNVDTSKNYSLNEIVIKCGEVENEYLTMLEKKFVSNLIDILTNGKRENLILTICFINNIIKNQKLKYQRLVHSGKKNVFMRNQIINFVNFYKNNQSVIESLLQFQKPNAIENLPKQIRNGLIKITEKQTTLKNMIKGVSNILDESVYGHRNAKRQIERVIGQWVSGEQKGYCFGFEGPPGLGKTSLAKHGISKCLVDKDGNPRPFSFIAIGGSSNGSVLDGHNYTYVGSTWGKIVDTLIETKCMNPIIFIDELDKVSKTEHGKEIIGILTHLVDTTQNDKFQDKYFSGIDLDLSKVLFIFSYNDVTAIDRILLDRIHRVKFDSLTIDEKIIISKKYLLKEIYDKMNLDGSIIFKDEILKFIINNYTNESGVRKLKEVLFEIISEINLNLLNTDEEIELPIVIDEKMIKYHYLKERNEVRHMKIPANSKVGIINGLWANYYGMGGIIPIEVSFFPSSTFFDLKLTGMQGDVMKESMHVAKTIAWRLTKQTQKTKLLKTFESSKLQGIHIHCPEGATPKDGPSAGGAITTALFSLLNNKKIKKNIAMTGEINMQGNITAIGGLELKIQGGIRGGVTEFIYPEENHKDFVKFKQRYENIENLELIKFYEVKHIEDVLKIVFDDN